MSLFVHYGDDSNNLQTSPTSAHFTNVASALFSAAQRQDADDSNLKSAAYQSLANVVLFAPMDCVPAVEKLQTVMVVKFTESQSLSTQIVNADDRMRFSELQSHICTVLQNSLKKLGRPDLHVADQIMTASLSILTNCSKGTELEDVMLLIGTLISEIESEFTRFAHPFIPLLNKAISNHAEYHLCTVAVGVVGDLARSMNQTLLPFCDDLMRHLLEALQDPSLARTVKPHVISSIGDVALAIGGSFVKYLPHTMTFFAQAGVITVQDEEDYDEIDFVCDIRESLLEAYTSIVQGFKDDQQALISLSQYVNQITEFISIVASDPNRSDAMVRAAIGLVGDLVDTYKSQMLPILRNDWLMRFIRQPLDDNSQVSESTLSVVKWTLNVR
jgi:importin subunit beta-1